MDPGQQHRQTQFNIVQLQSMQAPGVGAPHAPWEQGLVQHSPASVMQHAPLNVMQHAPAHTPTFSIVQPAASQLPAFVQGLSQPFLQAISAPDVNILSSPGHAAWPEQQIVFRQPASAVTSNQTPWQDQQQQIVVVVQPQHPTSSETVVQNAFQSILSTQPPPLRQETGLGFNAAASTRMVTVPQVIPRAPSQPPMSGFAIMMPSALSHQGLIPAPINEVGLGNNNPTTKRKGFDSKKESDMRIMQENKFRGQRRRYKTRSLLESLDDLVPDPEKETMLRGDGRTNLKSGRTIPELLKHIIFEVKGKLRGGAENLSEESLTIENFPNSFRNSTVTQGLMQSRTLGFFTIVVPNGRIVNWNHVMSEHVAPKRTMIKNLLPMVVHPEDLERVDRIMKKCQGKAQGEEATCVEICESIRFLCSEESKGEGAGSLSFQYTVVELGKAHCLLQKVDTVDTATFSAFVPRARSSTSPEKNYFL